MLSKSVYQDRRQRLAEKMETGLILFLGNDDSPINYADNVYPFRQDSTFLYYFGLNTAGLAALIDIDENRTRLYGTNPTVNSLIWTGPRPTVRQLANRAGVGGAGTWAELTEQVRDALSLGRRIHFPPPYRAETSLKLSALTGILPAYLEKYASVSLIRGIVSQRSVKTDAEIKEIESALDVTGVIYGAVLDMATPGVIEREIAARIEQIAKSGGGRISFSTIATVRGETLHNLGYQNRLKKGHLLLVDAGVESAGHYTSDITRTFPVGGRYSNQQKAVYQIVLGAQKRAIDAIGPNRAYRDIHLKAAEHMVYGLKHLGLMKGDAKAAVRNGAHGLFFPHGIGHMLGLDVHDMENLGEDRVGYDDTIKRDRQFGLAALRLAKPLRPGYVVTVEPGIYFIPGLIDQWKSEEKLARYINYQEVEKFKKLGGIRIEDDVLVTESGGRVLGKPIPKSVTDIEARMT